MKSIETIITRLFRAFGRESEAERIAVYCRSFPGVDLGRLEVAVGRLLQRWQRGVPPIAAIWGELHQGTGAEANTPREPRRECMSRRPDAEEKAAIGLLYALARRGVWWCSGARRWVAPDAPVEPMPPADRDEPGPGVESIHEAWEAYRDLPERKGAWLAAAVKASDPHVPLSMRPRRDHQSDLEPPF